jgi:hypothetical protein
MNTAGPGFYWSFGSFGSLSLTGLTGAGVCANSQRNSIGAITATTGGFRLNEFTVVPEPTSIVMLLGILGTLALLRRRRA